MGILGKFRKKTEEKQLDSQKTAPAKEENKKKAVKNLDINSKKTDKKTDAKKQEKIKGSNVAYKVLLGPVVTEKSATVESENKYSFLVNVNANKYQIKLAVKEAYGIDPIDVKTINVPGKIKRFGRNIGRRSDYKKAIVSLPKGKTINVHEGV